MFGEVVTKGQSSPKQKEMVSPYHKKTPETVSRENTNQTRLYRVSGLEILIMEKA